MRVFKSAPFEGLSWVSFRATGPQRKGRVMGTIKFSNEYVDATKDYYHRVPKSVLGAILVSLLVKQSGCEDFNEGYLNGEIFKEWLALHNSGIIKSKPVKP